MAELRLGGRTRDIAAALAPHPEASTLPREFYLDPEIYRLETEAAMRAQWLPLARVDQVPEPGDYLATAILGEQLVITRDRDGELRVLSNVCRHRAMPVAEGSGNCSVLRCPYHLWSYRLDGSLSGAPLMATQRGFDRSAVALPRVRHEVWQGWIMVNLGGAAPPLARQVPELTAELAGWDFTDLRVVASASYDCPWNWKLTVENFGEYYHHFGLHKDSLEPFLPARRGRCLDNRGEPWNSSVIDCSSEYLELQGRVMPGLDEDLAATMQIFTVFPLLCAGAQGSSAFWLQITPQSLHRHTVTWHVLVRPEQATWSDAEEFAGMSLSAIDVLQQEDARACRGVQAGLRSTTAAPGRFADLELSLWQFQSWLLHRLAEASR
jgi:phenylpropionate dioxygenase-like ring-hydroxylating dioxygenase large terminal subunit